MKTQAQPTVKDLLKPFAAFVVFCACLAVVFAHKAIVAAITPVITEHVGGFCLAFVCLVTLLLCPTKQ